MHTQTQRHHLQCSFNLCIRHGVRPTFFHSRQMIPRLWQPVWIFPFLLLNKAQLQLPRFFKDSSECPHFQSVACCMVLEQRDILHLPVQGTPALLSDFLEAAAPAAQDAKPLRNLDVPPQETFSTNQPFPPPANSSACIKLISPSHIPVLADLCTNPRTKSSALPAHNPHRVFCTISCHWLRTPLELHRHCQSSSLLPGPVPCRDGATSPHQTRAQVAPRRSTATTALPPTSSGTAQCSSSWFGGPA